MTRIYLDFDATTPIAAAVAEAMRQAIDGPFGNPSSDHWAGRAAKEALERARAQIASLLRCDPSEVVLTSGCTEANNLALKGIVFARGTRAHIVTTAVEHPSILNVCRFLERQGAAVTYLRVDGFGRVDPDEVRRAVTPSTVLISVMAANNEVGTMQPIAEIGRVAAELDGVVFHSDAAQATGKIPTNVDDLGVSLLSIAGHKFYAPKGAGALYVRSGTALDSLLHGASHEMGRRAGTESVVLAAALGTACELVQAEPWSDRARELRDRFWISLRDAFGDRVTLNGHPTERLPNTLNVSFAGCSGTAILRAMPEVAASCGSACHSGDETPSSVLTAMGVPPALALGAIRFSLGRTTTAEEIDFAVQRLREVVPRV